MSEKITLQDLSKRIKKSTATVRNNKKCDAKAKAAFDAQERATIAKAEELRRHGLDDDGRPLKNHGF